MATFKTSVNIDQAALQRELTSRDGAVGRTLAGFAGLVTQEINATFRERAGGAWWQVRSSLQSGDHMEVEVKPTRGPYLILPRTARALKFQVKTGETVFAKSVVHPGSKPPQHLVEEGIDRAARKFPPLRP